MDDKTYWQHPTILHQQVLENVCQVEELMDKALQGHSTMGEVREQSRKVTFIHVLLYNHIPAYSYPLNQDSILKGVGHCLILVVEITVVQMVFATIYTTEKLVFHPKNIQDQVWDK